ncbi:MAG: hypothetical protein FWC24_06690, partial [Treponema sp.]|nr:hypothetical protein [Treponema sp.]
MKNMVPLVFFLFISCQSAPPPEVQAPAPQPEPQTETATAAPAPAPVQTSTPSQALMNEFKAASAKAEEARKRAGDFGS